MSDSGKKTVKFVKNKYWIFLLALIILVAAGLRFVNINWDEGAHLHPDERFLSMVTNDIKWPGNVTSYFDSAKSPLNPANGGKTFFVYGTFPVFLTKFIGDKINYGHYEGYTLVGRFLSGFFDILTLIFVFLIARHLFDIRTGLLSSLLYAFVTLQIQHSHFFVVDLFLTFFIVLSFYFLLLFLKEQKLRYVILLGISLGFGLASKISAVLFAPIIGLGIVAAWINEIWSKNTLGKTLVFSFIRVFCTGLLIIALAFVIFRLAQPYAFEGPHIWNVKLSSSFTSSFNEIARLSSKESASGYVPAFQWVDRPFYFHIQNLILWGLGLPMSVFCLLGLLLGFYRLLFKREIKFLLLVAWPVFIMVYQTFQFVKSLRYLVPIIPFLVILGAFFIVQLYEYVKSKQRKNGKLAKIIVAILIISSLIWGVSFTNIYLYKQPRLQASKWIYENVPENSTASVEPWDDAIPIHLRGMPPPPQLNFTTLQLFGDDDDDKIKYLSEQLSNMSYVFVTSGRNYKVLPRLPRHFLLKRYYELLLNGSLGFKLEGEFTNYPKLFGVEIKDDDAEEVFVVYDHPTVFILKNEKRFNSVEIANLILGVD